MDRTIDKPLIKGVVKPAPSDKKKVPEPDNRISTLGAKVPALLTSFFGKNEIDVPRPFVRLWDELLEFCDFEGDVSADATFATMAGTFWRVYAVYRHNLEPKNVQLQMNMLPLVQKEFWDYHLPKLRKSLRPYILVNKYIINPWYDMKKWYKRKGD